MEFISALQFLRLNEISEAWVDAVWDLEFTEKKNLEDTVEERLTGSGDKAIRNLYQCLLAYAVDQQHSPGRAEASQSIWAILVEHRVSVKTLVAVLSYFVLTGKASTANVQQRVVSLHAASIYLLLLVIPGSIANKVFHELLFDTCCDLSSHCWPQICGKKRKKDCLKSNRAEGKRSKPQRKDTPNVDVEEEEEEEQLHFSDVELKKIREAVFLLIQTLLKLLQTLPLKDRQQSAINCAQIFSKLLYFEPLIGGLNFSATLDIGNMRSVPEMAFHGLQLLCSTKHGNQTESLRRVFHHLLYVILVMSKGSRGKPSPLILSQANLSTRDQAIHFVCYLVHKLKDLALPFLHILLQHICFQMVEKSEFRSHGAQAVGMLTSEMTSTDYAHFIKWLFNFSKHSKMVGRLFSVDVVMVLLEQPERSPEECQDQDLALFLPHKFLIQSLLFMRQTDQSPTVQGHALSCLAQCLDLPSFNVTQAVHYLFSTTVTQTAFEGVTIEGNITSQQSQKTCTLPFRTVEISTTDSSGCAAKDNMALLLQRIKDSKTKVRSSALQALVGLLKHDVIPMSLENLIMLPERCRDQSVSVRKKALQCVGELLAAKPGCSVVQKVWLQGVMPAVIDSENSVQDKAIEALDRVVLSQIKLYSANCYLDTSQRLTWDLLGLLCNDCQNLSRYFSRAFTIWSTQNKLKPTFITNLMSHTEADHAAGAWLLLSKVVVSSDSLPLSKILDAWENLVSIKDATMTTCCHIMSVLGNIAAHLNEDTKERIISDLMSWLKTFNMSLEVISAAVETLYQLCLKEEIKQTQELLNQHGGELVLVCEAHLAAIILNEKGALYLNEELMVKYLHTLGVVSLYCPAKIGKRTVLLVESVFTAQPDKPLDYKEDLPLSQFKTNSLPTRVRAHGVITLGKLCLQHEELVQKYLPVFARELEVGTEVAVRNNVVVIMCDLCVRYTTIVDHYIPNISSCLRDSESLIREQTLIMLTNLLQEEFVKWKGSLFFHFIVALVDPVPAIASLCEYCLLHLLLKKNPEMFSQHFIECIFQFNSYSKHKSYNKFPQNESEMVRFSLKGKEHREKRFQIYRFLLEHFTDAQRFNITNKINQTILACFADEELPLDADGVDILSETFNILSLKELKLVAISTPAGITAGEEGEDDKMNTMAKVVLQTAQKKVVSQVQKKAFIENAVPLIISLKDLLEQKRSPVLRHLMAYLQMTMQDYRNEVKEFFSEDEQLAAEVEFALRMAEREIQEQMEDCTLTEDTRTPILQGSVQESLFRSKPNLPVSYAAPKLPCPKRLKVTLPHTDGSRKESHILFRSIVLEAAVMSKGNVKNRAISTPKGGPINLSFDEGVSAIFNDQGTGLVGESGVHEQSKEYQAPQLRQWNVQSPFRQKQGSKM